MTITAGQYVGGLVLGNDTQFYSLYKLYGYIATDSTVKSLRTAWTGLYGHTDGQS